MHNRFASRAALAVAARISAGLLALVACAGLTGCLVAGYSSSGGWFIWPPLGLILLIALFVLLRRR